MTTVIEGQLTTRGKRFALIVGRFNSFLSQQIEQGALDCLLRHGAGERDIFVIRVPGSFEIPMAAAKVLKEKSVDAVIGLGVLVRGATPHFDYIASEVTKGLGQLALQYQKPVTYGIITADTLEQAVERAGTKAGNKGWDAALAAMEMVSLFDNLEEK